MDTMDGLMAIDSESTVMDSVAGRQWMAQGGVNGRRDGFLTAMDGAAAPRRR
jgi:hypothetical protein